MVKVCANHYGTIILLESFKTEAEANEFMKHDYILHYADEIEDGKEDEIVHANEMYISDDDIPFAELNPNSSVLDLEELDDLPY